MPTLRLQDILRQNDCSASTNPYTASVLDKLRTCRTPAAGYHRYTCDNPECSAVHYQYHGCKNRHCPTCNSLRQEQWMESRSSDLLPVKYFHVVFTLPHELNPIAMGNRTEVFNLLFECASRTLLTLCKDTKYLGAMPSITAVLHTWGQQLSFHPHVHCIVSGGGVDKNLRWKNLKKKSEKGYLFPYKVMEPLFKKRFLSSINKLVEAGAIKLKDKTGWKRLKQTLYGREWIVYAKAPSGNATQTLEYLARYTSKVALSNRRILGIDENKVVFTYRDYRDGKKTKVMQLSAQEFIRRFEQHILPARFVKIRHYGISGNFNRRKRVNGILEQMKLPPHPLPVKLDIRLWLLETYGTDILLCPMCKKGLLRLVEKVSPRNRGSPLQANVRFAAAC